MSRQVQFFKATTPAERAAINTFLARHNKRGAGSRTGYVAYYAAVFQDGQDGRPLLERLVAAAKICPLHTPQAARFFGGPDWRHVYCLQRLAAFNLPTTVDSQGREWNNELSRFLTWVLREAGKDARIWFVSTYADTGTFRDNSRPHDGGIYRACNAVYAGMTRGGGVEGFVRDGQRHSMRKGPRTCTLAELNAINTEARTAGRPEPVKILRASPMHRYVWAVGSPLQRTFRLMALKRRMQPFQFVAAHQPRLLARLRIKLMPIAA